MSREKLRYDQLIRLAESRDLKDARMLFQDSVVVGTYRRKDGSSVSYNAPYPKGELVERDLTVLLVRNRIPTKIDQQFAKSLIVPVTLLLPALILDRVRRGPAGSRGRARTDLFAEANGAAPAILFIDEIGAVGTRRGTTADATESAHYAQPDPRGARRLRAWLGDDRDGGDQPA